MSKTQAAPKKSAVIRQAFELLGMDAKAKDITAKCAALGVEVKPNLISNVRAAMAKAAGNGKKAGKAPKGRTPRRMFFYPDPDAAARIQATLDKVEVGSHLPIPIGALLKSTEALVRELGSVSAAVEFVKEVGEYL